MKKTRFLAVAVALVAVLVVSAWAGSANWSFGTLNGLFSAGQKTSTTSLFCRTLTGPSNSFLTNVTNIKGLIAVSSTNCGATTQCRVIMYQLVGANYTPIGSVVVPCGSSFSTSPKTITLPPGTYPANGSYCFAGEVTLLNPPTGNLCGFSYTSGSATLNWSP